MNALQVYREVLRIYLANRQDPHFRVLAKKTIKKLRELESTLGFQQLARDIMKRAA